jgi:parallel beta-helix repeat protein
MGYRISVKASTDVIYVPADYPAIQEAINSATSGDTIFVYKGIYYEHVVINKSVSLVGEDRDLTIIDGSGTGSVISITVNNVTLKGFTIKNSGMYPYDSGIHVEHSSGSIISHNKITNNSNGIGFYTSSNNVVWGNTISSNDYDGIGFYTSSNNVVWGNTISSNDYNGIYLAFISRNNTIYCNNFNNVNQVWSDLTNIWNYDDQGNYWSDYTGQDLNGDGIGDTVYIIDVNNQDNHPLMGMFSDFNVALKGKTYHIATICNSTICDFIFEIGAETGNRIIHFNATGEDSTSGFCRVTIPTELMIYPFIVLVDEEEIVPISLDVPNEAYVCLYFTYVHSSHTITIISSKTLYLYNELLDKYAKLQIDTLNLNATYHDLQNNYDVILGNYSQLQENYRELNDSYQEHLLDYSENVQNIRNLVYTFAATTAIFLITTVYLSKHAHKGTATRTKVFEEK